jgi:hypothetical protein
MGIKDKILSLILIPVIVLSLSGFKLHFHYCSLQDKLFTHFHVVTDHHINHSSCLEKDVSQSCCSPDNIMPEADTVSDHACCRDIISEVTTDNKYKFEKQRIIIYPAEVELNISVFDLKPFLLTTDYFIRNNNFIPPDILAVFVLRC